MPVKHQALKAGRAARILCLDRLSTAGKTPNHGQRVCHAFCWGWEGFPSACPPDRSGEGGRHSKLLRRDWARCCSEDYYYTVQAMMVGGGFGPRGSTARGRARHAHYWLGGGETASMDVSKDEVAAYPEQQTKSGR
ncbi:unnamed protein product [Ectocarpus fasciculatus]